MEGFGHHSAVPELLGQIQALAYERHSLKFDGRMRHSRRIDQLLIEIGRKSLQLLDPVSRLYQVCCIYICRLRFFTNNFWTLEINLSTL